MKFTETLNALSTSPVARSFTDFALERMSPAFLRDSKSTLSESNLARSLRLTTAHGV